MTERQSPEARDQIRAALEKYLEATGMFSAPKKRSDCFSCAKNMTAKDVRCGALALALYLDMPGSGGNVDLYTLLQAYLLDPAKRAAINAAAGATNVG